MDWLAWLSKSSLEAHLVYEYGHAFARNELDEGDISYFNHEFLQSMGVSIAKHRLEILKLARKATNSRGGGGGGGLGLGFGGGRDVIIWSQKKKKLPRPISRLLAAAKRTKRCLSRYIRAMVRRAEEKEEGEDDARSALVVVPVSPWRRGGEMTAKRNKRFTSRRFKQEEETLMVLNCSTGNNHRRDFLLGSSGPRLSSFSSLQGDCYGLYGQDKAAAAAADGGGGGHLRCWSAGADEFRWDAMFQDLKPT